MLLAGQMLKINSSCVIAPSGHVSHMIRAGHARHLTGIDEINNFVERKLKEFIQRAF